MRVLLYSEYFPPSSGGVETIVLELAQGLSDRAAASPSSERIEITVVTGTQGNPAEDAALPFRVVRRPRLWQLIRLMRDADLIHAAGPALAPLALGFLLRKPVVVEHHGFQVACPNGQMFYEPDQTLCPGHYMAGRYAKCLECNAKVSGLKKSLKLLLLTPVRRWLANRARVNITPTVWLAEILKVKRMRTVPHGIPPGPAAISSAASASTFAYVGRLVTTKGVSLLLQAAAQLRREGLQFCLKIIGDGPEREALKSQAAALDGYVEFMGHVPTDRQDEALSGIATVVIPSQSGEAFGLVAAENMLRGKLLIVSDIGSLREIVGDTGLVFPAGDAAALASCMRRVLEDPLLASSRAAAARNRAMQLFKLDSMIENHASLYREALTP
ncbi:MAG: glycosyltransferase family 4 protein [Candidatus Acidiferrales bacterium]